MQSISFCSCTSSRDAHSGEQYAAPSVPPVTVQLQYSYSQGWVIVLMDASYPL